MNICSADCTLVLNCFLPIFQTYAMFYEPESAIFFQSSKIPTDLYLLAYIEGNCADINSFSFYQTIIIPLKVVTNILLVSSLLLLLLLNQRSQRRYKYIAGFFTAPTLTYRYCFQRIYCAIEFMFWKFDLSNVNVWWPLFFGNRQVWLRYTMVIKFF